MWWSLIWTIWQFCIRVTRMKRTNYLKSLRSTFRILSKPFFRTVTHARPLSTMYSSYQIATAAPFPVKRSWFPEQPLLSRMQNWKRKKNCLSWDRTSRHWVSLSIWRKRSSPLTMRFKPIGSRSVVCELTLAKNLSLRNSDINLTKKSRIIYNSNSFRNKLDKNHRNLEEIVQSMSLVPVSSIPRGRWRLRDSQCQ